ncbi:MAG: hypothetical protein AABY95_09815 [Pseudomonadota bacterium]
MFKRLLHGPLNRFEREFDYDMSYGREILDADLGAFLKFGLLTPFVEHRRDVPAEAYYAAKLLGTMSEDCGPCTQLVVKMAERDGVSAEVLRAVLARKPDSLPVDAQLGYRFAEASLAHSAAADELREAVTHRWGRRGLVSLSFALVAARIFPTLKYALGHGKTCVRVSVGGQAQPVQKPSA